MPREIIDGVNDLIRRRLANQRLSRSSCPTPKDVVSWLGAMQSQDYPGAKWAIGLRADVTDEEVERACNEGAIIRTHMLRQTWHFVARDDIRWCSRSADRGSTRSTRTTTARWISTSARSREAAR